MDERNSLSSRRDFMRQAVATTAAGGLFAIGAPSLIGQEKKSFKIGLIGCGGRGSGALEDCLNAGKDLGIELQVVALCDVFEDRLRGMARKFKLPKERVFVGFDSYKKFLETDVEVVLMATPPAFRPVHLMASIQAGKHVFMEKPVAVDPPGARKVMEAGELAKQKGLSIAAGTQRRHERGYRMTAQALKEGAFGKIRGGSIYWCGGALWRTEKQKEWSDAEYMVRNWVSFTEMSGDHIVEQHVHNLDILNWYVGHPNSALGFGMRARRKTGNQFDFFSVDFEMPEGVHIHSMCRQVNGTDGGVYEHFVGSDRVVGGVEPKDKQVFPEGCPFNGNPYVQEHIDLLWSIMKGQPINEAGNVATSTMMAIMGRIASYTGKKVEWKHLTDANGGRPDLYNLTLKPSAEDFEKGDVEAPKDDVIQIPGQPS